MFPSIRIASGDERVGLITRVKLDGASAKQIQQRAELKTRSLVISITPRGIVWALVMLAPAAELCERYRRLAPIIGEHASLIAAVALVVLMALLAVRPAPAAANGHDPTGTDHPYRPVSSAGVYAFLC